MSMAGVARSGGAAGGLALALVPAAGEGALGGTSARAAPPPPGRPPGGAPPPGEAAICDIPLYAPLLTAACEAARAPGSPHLPLPPAARSFRRAPTARVPGRRSWFVSDLYAANDEGEESEEGGAVGAGTGVGAGATARASAATDALCEALMGLVGGAQAAQTARAQ